jgi:hypothetical protein
MASFELEVSLFMVKQFTIQQYDIGSTPLVVSVAGGAAGITYLWRTTMVALFTFYILVHLLVTVETEGVLGLLTETGMTAGAFTLFLGMAFNHLAGHQQGFNIGSRERAADEAQQQRQP